MTDSGTAQGFGIALSPTILITQGDARPWSAKWLKVIYCNEWMQKIYAGGGTGNIEAEVCVETFFTECCHVRDWIKGDIDSIPDLTEDDVDQWIERSEPLRTCRDICNSTKHRSRDWPDAVLADIRTTASGPEGTRVTIEIGFNTEDPVDADALQLAEACVKSWREFFDLHGIDQP